MDIKADGIGIGRSSSLRVGNDHNIHSAPISRMIAPGTNGIDETNLLSNISSRLSVVYQ
jgi:hypothetical protein